MQYTLKKSLGQHFLKEVSICHRIVDALNQHPFSQLVEVGPGAGALTKFLLQLPDIQFKAVELDEEKVHYLLHHYPQLKPNLIHQDFLQTPPPFDDSFTLVGNFPYNISTQIVFRILDWKAQVTTMVGMFQKEVAQRIVAPPGSKTYGILSVLVGAFYDSEYLFDVPPESFDPPPKVMSGVIRLIRKEKHIAMKDERSFFNLVKTAFNQRRKMLRNGVRGMFDSETLKEPIFNKRAEQLTIQEFADLTFRMYQQQETNHV